MILFSNTISPRLQYISRFISNEIGVDIELTTNIDAFNLYSGPRINYSSQRNSDQEIWIDPHSLLFEKEIRKQEIKCFSTSGYKAFFSTNGDTTFDIFSAVFYLLSRYEEYLNPDVDSFGRYPHKDSLAFKEGFLDIPLINIWLKDFEKRVIAKFPNKLPDNTRKFRFLPTYDIDESYSYKYKSWWRNTGAIAKAIIKGQWSRISERRKVLSHKIIDPYDSYEWMDQLHEKYSLKPRYFFLVAQRTGKYDRNILPSEPAQRQLISSHAKKYHVGVHPSWQSGDSPELLKEEIGIIETESGRLINSSRQHFIRFRLPGSYRQLINAGITEDHSMGYGSINGFRASVASPFYWYDLEKEEETKLLLVPFCFMEANSFYEQRFAPSQALDEMRHYHKAIKDVNGLLVTLWHNTFLGNDRLFAGWRNVYEQFIHEIHQ